MARVPLRDVPLQPLFKGAARSTGSFYVYYPTTTAAAGVAATVYGDATGTTTVTQPVPYTDYAPLQGWVDAGEYTLSANSYLQQIEASAGDGQTSPPLSVDSFQDPALSVENFPYRQINSVAATATSQTVRLVRIVPKKNIVAAKIVSRSGSTAVAATITKTVVGYYTTDGTTLTKVNESTTNLTSGLWDSTNTRYAQALNPATGIMYAGQVYYVALLVNATTAGNMQGFVKTASVVDPTDNDCAVPMYTKASETSLAATYTISALTTAYNLIPHVAVIAA